MRNLISIVSENSTFDQILCPQDQIRIERITKVAKTGYRDLDLFHLYQAVMDPVETGCKKMARIGNGSVISKL